MEGGPLYPSPSFCANTMPQAPVPTSLPALTVQADKTSTKEIYIYIYIYVCVRVGVCWCACACVRCAYICVVCGVNSIEILGINCCWSFT